MNDDDELDLAAAPGAEPERQPSAPRGRRGGVAGSVLAGALLGLRDALEGKPKEDIVIQVDADGDPPNFDVTGVHGDLDDGAQMAGPPLDDLKARAASTRRTRRVRPRRRPSR
jgi:hypothetical protein